MARRRLLPPFVASDLPPEPVADLPVPAREMVRPPVARVVAESAAEAALRSLSQEMQSLRDQGRMVISLDPAQIAESHLLRDRLEADPEDFAALKASIRAYGQRSPIEVSEIAPGRYGLISGWRRLHALRDLIAEEPARFQGVLALVRQPQDSAEAYVAMVEENEIRVGLSYWERARIALRTAEAKVFPDEREALRRLFAGASRARRSKIGSFMALVRALEGALQFPAALPERLGLSLAQALAGDPTLAGRLRKGLKAAPVPQNPQEEQARIEALLTGAPPRFARETIAREDLGEGLWLEARGARLVLGGPAERLAEIAALVRRDAGR